jgi:hypothetical protein
MKSLIRVNARDIRHREAQVKRERKYEREVSIFLREVEIVSARIRRRIC